MIESTHKKNIILFASIIIATMAVFILIYKKGERPADALTEPLLEEIQSTDQSIELSQPTKSGFDNHMSLTSDNIIWFTNYYRAQYGLKPLSLSDQLRNSAYYKSMDMFKHHYFAHYRPSNDMGFDNFVDNQKYAFIKIGENLAKGDFTTSKQIVDAWMNSPDHRQNILDTTYTEIGVSVDYGELDGERMVLITQHFGKPKTTCPTVNEQLRTKISILTKELIALKKSIDDEKSKDLDQLISQYNTTLKDREIIVNTYNNQVSAFDACVSRG